MRKKIVLGLVVTILLWLFYYAYTTSTIQISGTNIISNSLTEYVLTNQSNSKSQNITNNKGSLKKHVRSGTYEVSVKQNDKSFFAIAKTGKFFKKTVVSSNLVPEKSRQFVGDNPKTCVFYDNTLYSYDCDSPDQITTHVPASANQPTYTAQNSFGMLGTLESVTKTSGGVVALINFKGSEDSSLAPGQLAYLLSGGHINSQSSLSDLDVSSSYSIKPYQAGFLVYDDDSFSKLAYYASATSKAQTLQSPKPSSYDLKPFSLDTNDKTVLVSFANYSPRQEGDIPGDKTKPKTEVFMLVDGKIVYSQVFSGARYTSVGLCGNKKICLLQKNFLSIYDVSGKKALLNFKISGVQNFALRQTNDLLVVRDKEVLSFDPGSGKGFIGYSFGGYQYCGIHVDNESYLLCVTSPNGKSAELKVDEAFDNSDSIDKKVLELQKLSEVSKISINYSSIFISADFGLLIYNDSIKSFDYDQGKKIDAQSQINKIIDDLKIDRSKYTVSIIGS